MKIRIIIVVLFISCAPAWAGRDVQAIRNAEGNGHVSGTRWAVVVGVGNYDDQRMRDLEFSASDARLMASALALPELQCRVLLFADGEPEAAPTHKNVMAGIKSVVDRAGPNDMILVYFNGHGFPGELPGQNYLAVKDTDPDRPANTAIDLQTLYWLVDRSAAKARVFFLDAGHSGARKDVGYELHMSGDFLFNGRGGVTMASAQPGQFSYTHADKRAGAFTWFLAQGIKGEADANGDGLVTGMELEKYVAAQVGVWAVANKLHQAPHSRRTMSGDVVLGMIGAGDAPRYVQIPGNKHTDKRTQSGKKTNSGQHAGTPKAGQGSRKATSNSITAFGNALCQAGMRGDADAVIALIMHPRALQALQKIMNEMSEQFGGQSMDIREEMKKEFEGERLESCKVVSSRENQCVKDLVAGYKKLGLTPEKCGSLVLRAKPVGDSMADDELPVVKIGGKWYADMGSEMGEAMDMMED